MKNGYITLVTLIALCCASATGVFAQTAYDNRDALAGIKKAQVYFDVNLKDGDLLVLRLELLDRTIRDLQEADVDTSVVIGVRGAASRFITRDNHYVLDEQVANKIKIQDWIRQFTKQGFRVEQCAIAAEILDIPPADFLPEVTVVGNGYVSLIGYQTQGYAVVPMD
jgi:intracellular sulfur oxidation DsrE/DsrF family protein